MGVLRCHLPVTTFTGLGVGLVTFYGMLYLETMSGSQAIMCVARQGFCLSLLYMRDSTSIESGSDASSKSTS